MRQGSTVFMGSIAAAVLLIAGHAGAAPVGLGRITATSGILINRATGEVVWARNPDLQLPPASTTKVLTTLIALESARLNDTVRVSASAAAVPPSKLYMRPGWGMRVDDLVYALMLKSANDAAEVVAEGLSGSVDAFAVRMTQKAHALGATNSVFQNPHGLPAEGHLSTARDLTTIFNAAMRNPRFREIALTKITVIQPASGSKRQIVLRNHNRFLDGYQVPVIGKTGYTIAAKRCFVGAALGSGGNEYLVSVMGSRDLWGDLGKILDYAFASERGPELDVQMAEADSEPDIVPERLRLPRHDARQVAAEAKKNAKAKGKRSTEVAKVTVHSDSGRSETLSIGDADEDDRHVAKSKQKAPQGHYAVQLATVSSAARAEQLRASAVRKGYSAVVHSIGAKNKPQYRVRIEGFATRKSADRAAAHLRQAGAGVKPIVIGDDS